MKKELFQTLFLAKGIKIERIVSTGQVTQKGKWLKERCNEWVILLEGEAKLRFFNDDKMVRMKAGSYVLIPANTLHRVEWTDTRQKTIWLAVHFK